jgi:hypothetical protein
MGWLFNPFAPCCGCDMGVCFNVVGCCASAPPGAVVEVRPHGGDPEGDPAASCEPDDSYAGPFGAECCVDLSDFPEGDYDWTVTAPGYATQTGTVAVECGAFPTVLVHLCTDPPVPTLTLTDPGGNTVTLDFVPGSSTPCSESGEGIYMGAHTYSGVTPHHRWFEILGAPGELQCGNNYPPEVRPVTVVFSYSCGSLTYAVTTYCGNVPCVLIESPPDDAILRCDPYGLTSFGHGGDETTGYSPCLPVSATWPYGAAVGVCCGNAGPVLEASLMDAVFHPGGGSGGSFSVAE